MAVKTETVLRSSAMGRNRNLADGPEKSLFKHRTSATYTLSAGWLAAATVRGVRLSTLRLRPHSHKLGVAGRRRRCLSCSRRRRGRVRRRRTATSPSSSDDDTDRRRHRRLPQTQTDPSRRSRHIEDDCTSSLETPPASCSTPSANTMHFTCEFHRSLILNVADAVTSSIRAADAL